MRIAQTKVKRHDRDGAPRRSALDPDPAIVLARNGTAAAAASDVVSRILTSAVLEQYARDRNGVTELPPNESSDDSSVTAEKEASRNGLLSNGETAKPAPASANDPASADQIPVWKRLFDCALILAAAPLWLPVMIVIVVAVKLSSPGPVFYRQERVGYRGRRFMIFKFRTMKVNVETRVHESYFERLMQTDSPMTKLDANGDPRLIGCGRFLRAAGLDELPQLFNILRGDMSLVGPRPCTVHEFQRYLPWQRERVNAPPGLTGYWQVNGKNRTTFSEMISMDIFYAKNMSLALDLSILSKTLPAVVGEVIESRRTARFKPRAEYLRTAAQPANE